MEERRAADVKLAVIETKQVYIEESVTEIKGELKEMKIKRAQEQKALNEKLDNIEKHMAHQKGVIATIASVAVAIWGLFIMVAQQVWRAFTE